MRRLIRIGLISLWTFTSSRAYALVPIDLLAPISKIKNGQDSQIERLRTWAEELIRALSNLTSLLDKLVSSSKEEREDIYKNILGSLSSMEECFNSLGSIYEPGSDEWVAIVHPLYSNITGLGIFKNETYRLGMLYASNVKTNTIYSLAQSSIRNLIGTLTDYTKFLRLIYTDKGAIPGRYWPDFRSSMMAIETSM